MSIVKINWINPFYLLSIFFGVGLFPKFPGTFASFIGVIIWYYFLSVLSSGILIIFIVFSIITGIICCHNTARDMGVHDHNCIVFDEFIGIWLSLICLSVDTDNYILIMLVFFLFRCLDIFKPWPIILFHSKIKGGIGIIMDDIVSALITVAIIWLILNCSTYLGCSY